MAREISLLLAGDAQIARSWSQVRDVSFRDLIARIRGANVSIANLETVIHDFQNPAQADAGGVYMASPPLIAADLKWAGFDMLAHANNHAFDYGSAGVLETIRHVESQGLVIAGSGLDLQRARAPKYFECGGGTVALVAMACDFVRYGKASYSRPDVPGRPGINPLSVSRRQLKFSPFKTLERLRGSIGRWLGSPKRTVKPSNFDVVFNWGWYPDPSDVSANLNSISEATSKADVVVASIHAHRQGAWLTNFAREAINRGAHVVLIHGPHQIRGIELYRCCPILYSLGDFVFESEYVSSLPTEAYHRVGLPWDAPLDALRALNHRHTSGLLQDREAFQGLMAEVLVSEGRFKSIRLLPIDLNFEGGEGRRGRPQMASSRTAERIIRIIKKRSSRLRTLISYDPVEQSGEVILR